MLVACSQDSINRGIHTGAFKDVAGNRSYCNISVAIDPETHDNGPLGVFDRSVRGMPDSTRRVLLVLQVSLCVCSPSMGAHDDAAQGGAFQH